MASLAAYRTARLRAALTDVPDADSSVTATNDERIGDFETNTAMVLVKRARSNPRQLAEQIIQRIDVADLCSTPAIAGSGFITFRLSPTALAARFIELTRDERLGVPTPAQTLRLVVDFSSPNVA